MHSKATPNDLAEVRWGTIREVSTLAIEAALLGVARELSKQIARVWLGQRTAEKERGASLSDLLATSVTDRISRRKLERQIEGISDKVAERLLPFCEHEFRGLPENERAAAVTAAAECLAATDLSDRNYFSVDADPQRLADKILSDNQVWLRSTHLAAAGEALFALVVRESVVVLCKAIQQLPAFTPRSLAELLQRSARISEDIAEMLDRVPRAALMSQRGMAFDGEFQVKYKLHVSETQDQLELFGLDTRSYRLRTTVTTAFLSLNVTVEDATVIDRTTGEVLDRSASTGRRIEAVLRSNNRLMIRGDAGSGKTTLLQWLAVSAARGTFTSDLIEWNGLTPFLIKLRSYSGRTLPRPEEFVEATAGAISGLTPEGWTHRQLDEGHVLLLIDGVDEVQTSERPRVKSWLHELLVAYPKLRVVVTSRPAAATHNWLSSERFRSALVQPMSNSDVEVFCTRWHDAVYEASVANRISLPCSSDDLGDYKRAVLRHLESRKHLQGLATNPLMCAMLCALNLDRRKHLPPDRMRIYADAIQLLLDRRDSERDIPSVSDVALTATQKMTLLQYLAWRVSDAGRAELPASEATAHVGVALARIPGIAAGPNEVMSYLLNRSGLLREPIPGRIDFIHRTFQEYLTAKECAETHAITAMINRAHLDQWRETIIMAAGHVTGPHRDDLINGILDRAKREARHARRLRLLAAACLETMAVMPVELSERIDHALRATVPPRALRESRSLALAGDRALHHFPDSLEGISDAVAIACIFAAAYIGNDLAMDVLRRYATDPRREIQNALQNAWTHFDPREYVRRVLAGAPLLPWRGGERGHIRVHNAEQAEALSELEQIESVQVSTYSRQHVDPIELVAIPKLTAVFLIASRPIDLTPLSCHQKLASVTVLGAGANAGHQELHELPELHRVGLSFKHATAAAIDSVLALPKVDDLEFYDAVFDMEDILAVLGRVRDLGFTDCAGVVELDVLRNSELGWLRLSDCPVTDLTPLMEVPKLKTLWLEGAATADLASISAHPKLSTLIMYGDDDAIDLTVFSRRNKRQPPLTIRSPRRNKSRITGVTCLPRTVRLTYV